MDILTTIISSVLPLTLLVGMFWVGWLLQRSAMLSALKKFEAWKSNNTSQR